VTPIPAELDEHLQRSADRLGLFAGQIEWHESVGSTNDLAGRRAESGAREGVVITANAQESGRGRFGRSWASPPGAGIYTSVILRPSRAAASLLTVTAGVALTDGVRAATGLDVALKWPNDLVMDGRKLAGILAEGRLSEAGEGFVILGFGINVSPAAYPPDVAARATSIETELGRPADRNLLLVECLAALASRYAELRGGRSAAILEAWRARAAVTLRRTVEWDVETRPQRGIARDIDDTGALLVETPDGVARIVSGEVRWLG
jgi:BirA family biotin operon repressor/biotin-[acetyl-CoA-carboxylase] ligase